MPGEFRVSGHGESDNPIQSFLGSLFDAIPAALYLKDADGRYIAVNRVAAALLGKRPEEVVNRSDLDLFPADVAERLRANDDAVRRRRAPLVFEDTLSIGGEPRCFLTHKYPLDGYPDRVAGMSIDVTPFIERERRLLAAKTAAEQSEQARARYLAAASHDLRQPVQAATLYIKLLQDKITDHTLRRILDLLQASHESLLAILTALLDLARVEAGVVSPILEPVPVGPLLASLAEEWREAATRGGLELRTVPSSLTVVTDRLLLERILRNLLSNAITYTEHGKVLLGVRRRPGSAEIQVLDTGPGIPQQHLADIFKEFHQISPPGKRRHQGIGLGLAIVAQTARLLGHQVRVHSQVGRGSLFSVSLPRADATSTDKPQAEPAAPIAQAST